jgi:hypothetical protein
MSMLLGLLGALGLVAQSFASTLSNTGVTATTYTAGLTFNNDGTTTGNHASNVQNWYATTTAGIGSSFWARLTLSSALQLTVSGTLSGGGWVQLTSGAGFTVQNSTATVEGTANYQVDFALDSSGSSIVGTVSGGIDVGKVG